MIIHWNASPEIFHLGPIVLRWYGLLFAVGFALAYRLGRKLYRQEKVPVELVDSVLIYTVVGTVIGARLAHCLFYEPDYYLENPLEILMVWKGGLASHGAILGILASLAIFYWKHRRPSFPWMADMVCVTGPIAGAFIRLGNVMNSEIYGKPTSGDWGVIFERLNEGPIPRHPTQFYEAVIYFIIAAILWAYYQKKRNLGSGACFGLMIALVFGTRFFVEFFKVNQEDFDMGLPINMGQLLSIPFFAVGLFFFLRAQFFSKNRIKNP